jgi:hypothetical protein
MGSGVAFSTSGLRPQQSSAVGFNRNDDRGDIWQKICDRTDPENRASGWRASWHEYRRRVFRSRWLVVSGNV